MSGVWFFFDLHPSRSCEKDIMVAQKKTQDYARQPRKVATTNMFLAQKAFDDNSSDDDEERLPSRTAI
jgi:hypothetical protein